MGNRILYPAPTATYHFLEYADEIVWALREERHAFEEDGVPCVLLRHPGASKLLLYFHANSEDLGGIYSLLRFFRAELGVNVLAMEYAGYGVCSGEPSERRLLRDADATMRLLQLDTTSGGLGVRVSNVIAMGRSLGSAMAIYVASRYNLCALVTISAFSSIRAVVGLPLVAGWLVDSFDSATRIRKVKCPTLILHGSRDSIVPASQAQTLATECGADLPVEAFSLPTPTSTSTVARRSGTHEERSTGEVGRLTIGAAKGAESEGCRDNNKRVVCKVHPGIGHNDFNVQDHILIPIIHRLGHLLQGTEFMTLNGADRVLARQPVDVATDVAVRVPWAPDWRPPTRRSNPMSPDRLAPQRADPVLRLAPVSSPLGAGFEAVDAMSPTAARAAPPAARLAHEALSPSSRQSEAEGAFSPSSRRSSNLRPGVARYPGHTSEQSSPSGSEARRFSRPKLGGGTPMSTPGSASSSRQSVSEI